MKRRGVLREIATAGVVGLAGCSRAVRQNKVPGGIQFRNQRSQPESVTVRAFRLANQTPEDETPTPVDREPTVQGRFRIPAQSNASNDSFFPQAGTYLVAASNAGTTVRIAFKLFDTIGGGVGVDTVIVTLPESGSIRLRVTDID